MENKDTKEILFVCVHNAGRSQIAAALLLQKEDPRIHVRSAGTQPADEINPIVRSVLREQGIDLNRWHARPKKLDDVLVAQSDVVITMGCGDTCPIYPGKLYLDWPVDDPAGKSKDIVKDIYHDIAVYVDEFYDALMLQAGWTSKA